MSLDLQVQSIMERLMSAVPEKSIKATLYSPYPETIKDAADLLAGWPDENTSWLIHQLGHSRHGALVIQHIADTAREFEAADLTYLRDPSVRQIYFDKIIPLMAGQFEKVDSVYYSYEIARRAKDPESFILQFEEIWRKHQEEVFLKEDIEDQYVLFRLYEQISRKNEPAEEALRYLNRIVEHYKRSGADGVRKLWFGSSHKLSGPDSLAGAAQQILSERGAKLIIYRQAPNVPQAFISITDPAVAGSVLERLATEIAGSTSLSALSAQLKATIGFSLRAITGEAVRLYSDEIIENIIALAQKKPELQPYASMLAGEAAKMSDGPVGFRFLSRTAGELKLGDKCGDCTASDGINFWAMASWALDPEVQILQLTYEGKFHGKLHMMRGEVESKLYTGPAINIDATEFIPQVREHSTYHAKAWEALKRGIRRAKIIANQTGSKLYLNPESNSEDLGDEYSSYGIPRPVIFKRPRATKTVTAVLESQGFEVESVPYYIQSLGPEINSPRDVSRIERTVNQFAKSHPNDPIVVALRNGDIQSAANMIYSDRGIGEDLLRIVANSSQDLDIQRIFQSLYGPTEISGNATLVLVK